MCFIIHEAVVKLIICCIIAESTWNSRYILDLVLKEYYIHFSKRQSIFFDQKQASRSRQLPKKKTRRESRYITHRRKKKKTKNPARIFPRSIRAETNRGNHSRVSRSRLHIYIYIYRARRNANFRDRFRESPTRLLLRNQAIFWVNRQSQKRTRVCNAGGIVQGFFWIRCFLWVCSCRWCVYIHRGNLSLWLLLDLMDEAFRWLWFSMNIKRIYFRFEMGNSCFYDCFLYSPCVYVELEMTHSVEIVKFGPFCRFDIYTAILTYLSALRITRK